MNIKDLDHSKRRVFAHTALIRVAVVVSLFAIAISVLAWINVTRNPERSKLFSPANQTALSETTTLNVVTYNIEDLAFVSSHRTQRMRAIGRLLAEQKLDVIALQEAFVAKDREVLIKSFGAAPVATYHKYFASGFVGSGLLVLSRYPIHQHAFKRYTNNGKWYKFNHGDWWAGKGVAAVRLEIAERVFVDVYNTHLQAEYRSKEPFEYGGVQLEQIAELAQFANSNRSPTVPQLLLGDLNFPPKGPQWELANGLMKLANLTHKMQKVDYILGIETQHYRWELIQHQILRQPIELAGESVQLSDHPAFISRINLEPR